MTYKGVECQSIEKENFIDNRNKKFIDEITKCLCFKCFRICEIRNTEPKTKQVISCSAYVSDFTGEYNRKIKNRVGLILDG